MRQQPVIWNTATPLHVQLTMTMSRVALKRTGYASSLPTMKQSILNP